MDKNVLHSRDFSKILYLDNFYNEVDVENEDGSSIFSFLKEMIDTSNNTYIKRTSCKIICELTAVGIIRNSYSSLGVLLDFLLSDTNSLVNIALKQLPFFVEFLTEDIEKRLVELTDNDDDGDISSQAYFFLGIKTFLFSSSKDDLTGFISAITEAEKYFLAAENVTENRDDTSFYIFLIQLTRAWFTNDYSAVSEKTFKLYQNLKVRALYEMNDTGLEVDYLIFQMFELLNTKHRIASKSQEWLNV
ncbi:hypothetical protein, partial [Flavobacterium sp.]|uniref:hypothetical protein n=1 Tax=Flavobacterium sp. TaxID=239 RepID=UPI0026087740